MPLVARPLLSIFWKLGAFINHKIYSFAYGEQGKARGEEAERAPVISGRSNRANDEHELVRRIAVVRALPGLGDFLCAVPGLRALRQLWPKAHIALVGLPSTQTLVQRFNLVDELIPFPGFPGIVEKAPDVEILPAFLQEMQARAFDLAIQMHGSGSFINPFTLLLGAKRTVGYHLPPTLLPDAHIGNNIFVPYPDDLHEIHRNLRLVEVYRFASTQVKSEQDPVAWADSIDFPLSEDDWEAYGQLAQAHHLQASEYVCLHAGASVAARRWSPQGFAQVGAWLREQGYNIVLTGTEAEAEATAQVASQLGQPLIDLTGKTDLGVLALTLNHARLLVCNDTGASHVAAAVETPSVVICIDSDRRRWAPLNRSRHRSVAAENGKVVEVSEVLAHLRALLEKNQGRLNASRNRTQRSMMNTDHENQRPHKSASHYEESYELG